MGLRTLNSFAGGMAKGIDSGMEIANRKKAMDIAQGRFGLEQAADKREESKWSTYKAIFDKYNNADPNGGQFAEGAQNLPAAPVQQPSITQQATPNAQAFQGGTAASAMQAPAQVAPATQQFMQPGATPSVQPAARPPRKLPELPFMDGPLY